MTDEQVRHMTERFLSWRLPEDFRPDGGVEFDADSATRRDPRNLRHEPRGTNLLHYAQAEAMVRAMLEGLPAEGGGAGAIAAERRRQVGEKGYGAARDDGYRVGQLALAGAAYAAYASFLVDAAGGVGSLALRLWPWNGWSFRPRDARGCLVRAGALVAAEIDRLDRASAPAA